MKQFQYLIKSFTGILFFILILFVSAGRLDYYYGWIFTAMSFGGLLLSYVLTGDDRDLLEERTNVSKDVKEWDKRIVKLSVLATIIAYVVAGLDSGRYHWSPTFHWSVVFMGIVFIFLGQLLFLIAKKTNPFFSSVMRIQHDRGHTVCETGVYQYVRHPGYLGMIISWVGFPLLLGSVWSILPILFAIVLLLIRTHMEDRTLATELHGYSEYLQKTRYKLIPRIW